MKLLLPCADTVFLLVSKCSFPFDSVLGDATCQRRQTREKIKRSLTHSTSCHIALECPNCKHTNTIKLCKYSLLSSQALLVSGPGGSRETTLSARPAQVITEPNDMISKSTRQTRVRGPSVREQNALGPGTPPRYCEKRTEQSTPLSRAPHSGSHSHSAAAHKAVHDTTPYPRTHVDRCVCVSCHV